MIQRQAGAGVLVMGPEQVAQLHQLRAHAETHERDQAAARTPAGDDPAHCLVVPRDFRLVFSIDQYELSGRPGESAWFRVLSISVSQPGRLPHPFAIETIMPELGFVGGLARCVVSAAPIGPGHEAIHVYQRIIPPA